ncbi:MAG: Trp family transcriptional regulator [Patescibacteria group bacterium]
MNKISEFEPGRGLTRWEENVWSKFLDNIEKASSKKEIAELLDNLLSSNEKILISKRLAAMALIKNGKSYREIGKILWISPGTVSALKKSVYLAANYKSNRYYAGKNRNEKIKRIKEIPPQTIFDYWINFPIPKKTGKGRWKFLSY